MFIPFGTEIDAQRPPVVTGGLIAANFLVAIVVLAASGGDAPEINAIVSEYAVRRDGFRPWQLLTSMFLHDLSGVMHLAGNMLFLWVFGCAVEQRLGRMPFLVFYLLGGAVAGVAHVLFSAAPAIGASGAVSAVLGAYLVLFPLAQVRVVFFLLVWGVGTIPAWWVIGLYFVIDVASQVSELLGSPGRNVAYMAHLAGSLFGFTVAMVLLRSRLVHRSQTDLLYLLKQSTRRQAMRNAANRGAVWRRDIPHRGGIAKASTAPTVQAEAKTSGGSATTAATATGRLSSEEFARRRGEIAAMMTSGDAARAVEAYRRLLQDAPGVALPPAQQLEIANRLMAEDAVAEAASAYESYLRIASPGAQSDEVRLLLGLIYVRRQPDFARARPLLEQVRSRLRDERRALADQLLAELAT